MEIKAKLEILFVIKKYKKKIFNLKIISTFQITVVVPPASSPTITGGRTHYKPGVKIQKKKNLSILIYSDAFI